MKQHKPLRAVLAAGLAIVAWAARPEAQPARHLVSIPDLLSIRQVALPEMSPDGRAVLYTVRGWEDATGKDAGKKNARAHVWRVNSDGTGQRQLTYSEQGETAPAWSPDGALISFLSARDGGSPGGTGEDGPRAEIWLMPADGGEAWKLTDAKESISGYAWSPDGTKIAYVSRDPLPKALEEKRKRRDDPMVFEGDFRMSHLWVVDVAGATGAKGPAGPQDPPHSTAAGPRDTPYSATEVVSDPALTVRGEPTWSADSRRIAFAAAPTTMTRDDRTDIYIATHGEKTLDKITTNLGPDTDPVWSPDGATIAYLSSPNAGAALGDGIPLQRVGNEHLMLYTVATHQAKDAASRDFDLSPGGLHWSPDSREIVFTAGVKTATDVFAYATSTGKYSRLTDGRIARLGSVGRHGAALVMESSSEPAEIYGVRLKPDTTNGGVRLKPDTTDDFTSADFAAARKLTDTNPQARAFELGTSEVISWKSDGFTIDGVLLLPVNYQPGTRYPLLVVAHGGPTGAYVNNYRVGYGDGSQNWAGEGWAVLYPNPRGSSNYGEKFMQANFDDWGGGDYRDIMAGVDAVVAKGIADPDKMAFMGWSYGGYMTCWVVSQTTRFKAAMMGAGITDVASMYNTNDIPNYLGTFFGGIPSKSTMALYAARSGITYVDRVTTPLLILHGGSDQRVPVGQPMEFYRALKDRGKTVELVFYPREGHGFSEYYHQLDRLQRQHEWIGRYTLGAGAKKTNQQ